MTIYQFNTTCSMKEYNRKKWWIDRDTVKPQKINADTLKEALQKYADKVNNHYCIEVSKNGLKNKQAMYIDTKEGETIQTGYVITGKTMFQDDIKDRWTDQYIDLWVDIYEITRPKF